MRLLFFLFLSPRKAFSFHSLTRNSFFTSDSQDVASEDDELLEGVNEEDTMEEGDDDVISTQQPPSSSGATTNPPPQQQMSSASASREQRLQNERALIPSPQELMMRQR